MPGPTNNGSACDLIRAIVRGECEFTRLAKFGVRVGRYDDFWEIDNSQNIFAEVTAKDVAQGLARFKDNPEGLRVWAGFVLAGSSLIGLDSLTSRPDGDKIVDALWDAAFDGHLSLETEALTESILADD